MDPKKKQLTLVAALMVVLIVVLIIVFGPSPKPPKVKETVSAETIAKMKSQVAQIQKKEAMAQAACDFAKENDPMSYVEAVIPSANASIAKTAVTPTVISFPELSLGGIMWDESMPVAIINHKSLQIGDVVAGATVTQIAPDRVTVRFGEYEQVLVINKGEVDTNDRKESAPKHERQESQGDVAKPASSMS